MNKEELKQKVCEVILSRRQDIIDLGEAIFAEPELGYKETKTAAKVESFFRSLNIPYESGLALTGVKGRLKGKESKYTVAVLSELDAVICHEHAAADPATGAAHCCGHNAQIAAMAGAAIGLSTVMDYLAGDVVFFAVPAEEYVEITYRNKLREQGKLKYLGGKPELIRLGAFDDIDLALQPHVTTASPEGNFIEIPSSSNGFIGKLIRYQGKSAHAAGAPHAGINALNAALLGIMGVHAQRETFKDEDHVRFHPIITHGGDLVNVIPSDVRMESYVRAANIEAMKDANVKINRALTAGASAVGAEAKIQDLPGYLPLCNNAVMNKLFQANAEQLVGKENVRLTGHLAGSTDTGDLSHLIPLSHPWIGGVAGALHSKDYQVLDQDLIYIKTAQSMAMTVIDLLAGGAAGAAEVFQSYQPIFSKEEYLAFLDSFATED